MSNKVGIFNILTNVSFGNGAISKLTEIIKENEFQNVLVITDKGISSAGIIDIVVPSIREANITIYDGTLPNPTISNCEEAYKLYKENNVDVVVGIGGGSPLDVAKAVALLATNGGSIDDYEGIGKFKNDLLPLIAIPTTAGTASEVTNFTVITDEERQYKLTVGGSRLAARWAIIDPELTYGLPPHITAATGLDALVHAIESYTSKEANDITKTLAREATRKIGKYLRQAVYDGDNIIAREEMMMGSLLAGLAFNNTRLGNCHAMSHPISAVYAVPHGVANAILIPYVMKFNSYAAPDLYRHIGEDLGGNIEGLTVTEQAINAANIVRQLSIDIGLPTDLQSFNVTEEKIDLLTRDAMLSGNILVNPRKTSAEDIKNLYRKAIRGEY
ncbi:iron-containing alcohol dehydrogenase [Psychrobacillus soli]|uniref:Iron-containing alcohol dehydrogenase n=1 Tax=Psychrobacillus soli TaxID=1543965 RepID=A0A544TLE3_9BACI|nr:iron-containing alcohol dehydrogenase [Psychrobacillus soli]TQR18230.1 iron-containing alcohol dehydrogenase [Psychrobacillus soli]